AGCRSSDARACRWFTSAMSSRGPTASSQSTPPPESGAGNPRANGQSSRTRFSRRRPLSVVNAVSWLNGSITAAAAVLFFTVANDYLPVASPRLPWWALGAGFFVAERCVVHLHFRRNAHSFSLGDIPLVFGLVFAS